MACVLLSVRLQCSCVLFTEEAMRPLGNLGGDILGGDMPLRSVLEPFGYTRASSTDFCHPIRE